MKFPLLTAVIGLASLSLFVLGVSLGREQPPAPALRIPVASVEEAKRLSRDDQLGRYFDCLEYEVETSMLQTCEE